MVVDYMQEGGRWVTINGTHVFVKDGQNPMDAFIKQRGESKSENLGYDAEVDGKLTRNKMKAYLNDVSEYITNSVDNDEYFEYYSVIEKSNIKAKIPDYDGTILDMRAYGYGMKDISRMQFQDEKSNYRILATFNDGNKIVIYDATKY